MREITTTRKFHDCGGRTGRPSSENNWSHCTACEGRLHMEGCTARKNKHKDCCPARHKMLHDQGQVRGIVDGSIIMWPEAGSDTK